MFDRLQERVLNYKNQINFFVSLKTHILIIDLWNYIYRMKIEMDRLKKIEEKLKNIVEGK